MHPISALETTSHQTKSSYRAAHCSFISNEISSTRIVAIEKWNYQLAFLQYSNWICCSNQTKKLIKLQTLLARAIDSNVIYISIIQWLNLKSICVRHPMKQHKNNCRTNGINQQKKWPIQCWPEKLQSNKSNSIPTKMLNFTTPQLHHVADYTERKAFGVFFYCK